MTSVEGVGPDGRRLRIQLRDGVFGSIEAGGPSDQQADGSGPHCNQLLLPGLVDLQVNGFAGFDINDERPAADTVISAGEALARQGTAAWCPTVITAPESLLTARLRAVAEAADRTPKTAARVVGIHVEGPFLAAADGPRGAHDAAHLRLPDLAEFHRWQRAAGGLIRIVTLAPELPGALDFIRSVSAGGVLVAIGHTAATPDQVRAAAAAGARLSTHLGNGAHPVLPRHPNYLWAQLADDRLTATFIADGHHLPADTFTTMVRAKGIGRSVLVSDSAALAGQAAGRYPTPVGGAVDVRADGSIALPDSDLLAGSGASLADCLRWAVGAAGLTLLDVSTMAAANPAALLGLDSGRLEAGAAADLTVLDRRDLSVLGTLCAGEWAFQR